MLLYVTHNLTPNSYSYLYSFQLCYSVSIIESTSTRTSTLLFHTPKSIVKTVEVRFLVYCTTLTQICVCGSAAIVASANNRASLITTSRAAVALRQLQVESCKFVLYCAATIKADSGASNHASRLALCSLPSRVHDLYDVQQ